MEVVSSNMCKTSEKGGISERSENGENSDLSEKKWWERQWNWLWLPLIQKKTFLRTKPDMCKGRLRRAGGGGGGDVKFHGHWREWCTADVRPPLLYLTLRKHHLETNNQANAANTSRWEWCIEVVLYVDQHTPYSRLNHTVSCYVMTIVLSQYPRTATPRLWTRLSRK